MPQSPDSVQASAARIRKPGRPEVCRKGGLMSGVLTKKFGRKKSRTGGALSSVEVFDDLLLGVAPREVGVGLGEADLRQPVHQLRPGERLGQEDHIRMPAANVGDHPMPERQRLGVRIVDAEDAHALVDPELHRRRAARTTAPASPLRRRNRD